MKPKIRKPKSPVNSTEYDVPRLRLVDVIDEVSKLAADPAEAARVINHMFSRRAISFAADFNPRRLRMKLH